MTSTSAGSTPANRAPKPSLRIKLTRVPMVDGFLGFDGDPVCVGRSDFSSRETEDSDERAVIRVLTTQIGFVRSTVKDPAMAPQSMDSAVVSRLDTRPALSAAVSRNERVYSYPMDPGQLSGGGDELTTYVFTYSSNTQSS